MPEWFHSLRAGDFLTPERVLTLVRAGATLIGGTILARLIAGGVVRVLRRRLDAQETMLFRKLIFYGLFVLVGVSTLHQLGFKLGVLLGAAGVLTVALGFASQTSASNLISGLFLIVERPFVVGDIIQAADVTGEVLSIDLLSIKLRTFDNLYVRVPNETIIKTRVTNLTHFPLRRVDVEIAVAYKEDIRKVRDVLYSVADRNPLCLEDPRPLFIFRKYGDSGLELQFSVWGARKNYLDLMNSIRQEIKQAFDENGIEIPFPHRSLYTGAATEPFPVRVVQS